MPSVGARHCSSSLSVAGLLVLASKSRKMEGWDLIKKLLGAEFCCLRTVVRALKFLQEGRDSANKWEAVTIPRGTLQVR
nr:protease Do-like 7 [Ipomoea batatas]